MNVIIFLFLGYLLLNNYFLGSLGRPEIDFSVSSERSKRRKVQNIKMSSSAAELALATSLSLREEGDIAATELISEVTTTTPSRARRVLSKWRKRDNPQREMTPEEAVYLIITNELTKSQHNALTRSAQNYGLKLYPSYD